MCTYKNIGFYRWEQVEKLIPISKATWWEGVKKKRYPPSYELSENTVGWLKEDIHRLLDYIHKYAVVGPQEKWEDIKLID